VIEYSVIDDPHYTAPLYYQAEAAHIIDFPAQIRTNVVETVIAVG
jgi:hypothetical protein